MNLPLFTDVRGLMSRTAASASPNTPHAELQQAAEQMEALFVQELFKAVRASSPKDGLFNSEQTQFYQEMLDQQLAMVLARQGKLGLSAQIVRQLATPQGEPQIEPFSMPHRVPTVKNPPMPPGSGLPPLRQTASQPPPPSVPKAASSESWQPPKNASEFVQQVWRYAQTAAAELGISPRILVAQAAHESAWGRSMPRLRDGRSSHNLFGIKAHGGWNGPVASSRTHEFVNGRRVNISDGFRAYESFGESFMDYVAFLRRNRRYATALQQTNDEAFIRELQRAGYATDPNYANKVLAIAKGPRLNGG